MMRRVMTVRGIVVRGLSGLQAGRLNGDGVSLAS